MDIFLVTKQRQEAKIVEKKSTFIAVIFPILEEVQVKENLEQIRKKYYDAKHHCYAYRILEDERVIEKCSDDGEPSGTAGAPILSILQNRNLVNVMIVVIRYFGGILLGTGGLVRAYTEASNKVLEQIEYQKLEKGYEYILEVTYSELENWKYYCRKRDIHIKNAEYGKNITLILEITVKQKEEIEEKIGENQLKLVDTKKCETKYISKNIV